jgi:hypothetical protein
LEIPVDVDKEWTFKLEYGGPPNLIRAVSKTRTYGGEGDYYPPVEVVYDVAGGQWTLNRSPMFVKASLTDSEKSELAEDAIKALEMIAEGAKVYYLDKGEWPETVERLETDQYIMVNPSVYKQWQFGLVGEPIQTIVAISTNDMPGGAGHTITYDMEQKSWQGYGTK